MQGVLVLLLVVRLVLIVLGAVVEGLFRLAVVGPLLFLGTAAPGRLRRRS